MRNNKGFTLVELLAVVAILGIIMAITIPNILGFIDRNERTTYVEDAKKLIAIAEAEYRSNTSLDTNPIILTLDDLNAVDIIDGPKGNEYNRENSYVIIYDQPGGDVEYEYFVSLYETSDSGIYSGLPLVHRDVLYASDAITYVEMDLNVDNQNLEGKSSINASTPDGGVSIDVSILQVRKGDCNNDGLVNGTDAQRAYVAMNGGITNPNDLALVILRCDMDNDGVMTRNDYNMINTGIADGSL